MRLRDEVSAAKSRAKMVEAVQTNIAHSGEEGSFISAASFSLRNDRLSGLGASLSQTDAPGYGAGRRNRVSGIDGGISADKALAFMEGRAAGRRGNHADGIPFGAAIQPEVSDMGLSEAPAECAGAGVSAVFGGLVGD